jgi:hypothetical protein
LFVYLLRSGLSIFGSIVCHSYFLKQVAKIVPQRKRKDGELL